MVLQLLQFPGGFAGIANIVVGVMPVSDIEYGKYGEEKDERHMLYHPLALKPFAPISFGWFLSGGRFLHSFRLCYRVSNIVSDLVLLALFTLLLLS